MPSKINIKKLYAGIFIVIRKLSRVFVSLKQRAVQWTDFDLLSSEIAAWLAENGPVSVALNAFAMQVNSCVTTIILSHTTTEVTEALQFDILNTLPSTAATSRFRTSIMSQWISISKEFNYVHFNCLLNICSSTGRVCLTLWRSSATPGWSTTLCCW